MHHVREYLAALFHAWVGRMSGLASVALLFLPLLLPSIFANSKVIERPTWAAAALCFLIASYAAWLREREGVSISAVNVKGPLLDAFLAVMKEIASAQSSAHRTKREIESILPPTKKVSALVYARRICIVAESPISSDEIVRKMRSAGYVSRGKRPADYLRRVLRQSGEFIELWGGTWQFRPRSMGSPGSLSDSVVQQNAAI